jgi:hypothetical protein
MRRPVGLFVFDESIDVSLVAKRLEDWNVGYAILHPGFFRSGRAERVLRSRNRRLWLNLPVFYNPPFLEEHPDFYSVTNRGRRAVHDWSHFVCPSRPEYLDHLLAEYRELVRRAEPEYVSLDFIRFFVYWEGVPLGPGVPDVEYGCFCETCRRDFENATGLELKAPAADAPAHVFQSLAAWKTRLITDTAARFAAMIRELDPAVPIGIKAVPWRTGDLGGALSWVAGQDLAALLEPFDHVIPMTFALSLKQNLAWKADVIETARLVSGRPAMSYLQTGPIFDETVGNPWFEQELDFYARSDCAGLAIFHFEHLVHDEEKQLLLRTALDHARG